MVRGSALRVTGLGARGEVPDTIPYAVSKSVSKVVINERVETGRSERIRNAEDKTRLAFNQPDKMIRYLVDIDFLRVDPGVLSLVAGVPLVYAHNAGFDELPFDISPFDSISTQEVRGFDSTTRKRATSFGLEVWTRLAGVACAGDSTDPMGFGEGLFGDGLMGGGESDSPGFGGGAFGGGVMGGGESGGVTGSGGRRWGYTVFPYLRGGYLSGFEFKDGLVSFNLRQAQTRRAPRWGVGPHDLEGSQRRLTATIPKSLSFRSFITLAQPPPEQCGIIETTDVIDGGSATLTTDDVIDGGTADSTSAWIVEGGSAA